MNNSQIDNVEPDMPHNSETNADASTSSHTCTKPPVGCRFSLSHRLGVAFIIWFSKVFRLSLEQELRLGVKYLKFIYRSSPFAKCQRERFVKNVKSFVVLTAPVEWYLIAVSIASVLQSCLIVLLSLKLLKQ